MSGTPKLNLPDHGVKTRQGPAGTEVFDPWRRKWLLLTPEEWVRQHVLGFLVHDRGCPPGLITVERGLQVLGRHQRTDVVVHTAEPGAPPLLLVECKAPTVKLDRKAFEQAARYNLTYKVPFLLVTNGLVHYVCRVHHKEQRVEYLVDLPAHAAMLALTDR